MQAKIIIINFPKVKKHRIHLYIIDRKDKFFPFTKAKGILGNPGNDNSGQHNGSSTNEKEFDPPNEKCENNIKDKGKLNKKKEMKRPIKADLKKINKMIIYIILIIQGN